jgi:hypothetical protein
VVAKREPNIHLRERKGLSPLEDETEKLMIDSTFMCNETL